MDCLNNVTSISEIVRKANIGLWAIEAKEGLPMRLYVDEVMAGLLGVDANIPRRKCSNSSSPGLMNVI